ncbi:MAG: TldD/PmbA family protein [Candidatus Micrarchaeia archaeon]
MTDFPSPAEMLEKTKFPGADAAEVYFSGAKTLSVEYGGSSYKNKEVSEDKGYGVRTIKNKRAGFSHTNTLENFSRAADTAIRLSGFSPKTGFSFEPPPKKYPKIQTTDTRISGLPLELAFSAVEEILGELRKYAEPTRISVSFSEASESIANTEGLSASCCYTDVTLYAEAKKGKGTGYFLYSSRMLPESFGEIGRKAGRIAKAMAAPSSIPTQEITVKFSPDMLRSLLGFLLFSFDGDNKRRGITRLEKGEDVFSPDFTLSSNPISEGDSSCIFDGEGVPSFSLPLIENGKVKNFFYDRQTAALEGVNEGGSCQRSDYASPPSPGLSNLVIEEGNFAGGPDERFLEIISFHGLHTSNPVSGDFGVDVDVSFLHENGEKKAVSDILLTGNIFNLFNSIKHIGKKQSVHANLISPEIWFSDLHIIGK